MSWTSTPRKLEMPSEKEKVKMKKGARHKDLIRGESTERCHWVDQGGTEWQQATLNGLPDHVYTVAFSF